MPLKLVPPRKGKSPNWTIRGTYLGHSVDRTSGTPRRSVAAKVLAEIERRIEAGELRGGRPEQNFAEAALAYVRAGGEKRFLKPILPRLAGTPVSRIDQALIDEIATAVLPNASPATRNRQVYTPIRAVLRRAGVALDLHRPKGAAGRTITAWLWPEQANALFAEARRLDPEFEILLITLCYTGLRLGELLGTETDAVRLAESFAFVGRTKNGDPRAVFLPPVVVTALANHPRGMDRPGERVFRFHKGGHLYSLLAAAAARAGVTLPDRSRFHLLRHTYATWMRRFGGLDVRGLAGTGAWADPKSAARYAHVVASEEAARAAMLPVPKAPARARTRRRRTVPPAGTD